MSMYVAGLDLGQVADYTALTIVEAQGTPLTLKVPCQDPEIRGRAGRSLRTIDVEGPPVSFVIHYLGRDRGVPYPQVVEKIGRRIGTAPGVAMLAVDATGVGRPVVDLFAQAGLKPWGITITSGSEAHGAGYDWHVPKIELVSAVLVPFQGSRLVIPRRLALSQVLAAELQTFRVKITTAANPSYGAWREGEHDDLVLAVAMACWLGTRAITAGAARAQAAAKREALAESLGLNDDVQISPV